MVPRAFVTLMEDVIRHGAHDRFALLYEALWRLRHGDRDLLARADDPLMPRLADYAHEVQRAARLGAGRPPVATTIQELGAQAADCTRCPLHAAATRTVFGEGPADA